MDIKRNRRGLVIVLTVMLMLSMTVSFSFATPRSELNSQINENKAKSSELEKSMEDTQSQLDSIEKEIKGLNDEIKPLQEKVEKNKEKLADKEKELKEQEENLDQRLRNMYKNGSMGFVDVILSSEDIEDLIANFELVSKIYAGDKAVVGVLEDQYDEVAEIQKDLDEQETKLNAKIDELNTSQEKLYDTYEQAKADKATVDKKTSDLVAELAATPEPQAKQASTTTATSSKSTGGGQTYTASSGSKNYSGGGSSTPAKSSGGSSGGSYKGSASGSAVVNYAMQFLGNPYVYGGTSLTNGIDCSGFTMKIYGHFGKSLPHYSESQPSYGKRVYNPQPGDLVHYPGHVGIYIGGGKLIHASNPSSGIKISPVNYRSGASYYRMF